MSPDGQHTGASADQRARRNRTIVLVVAVALAALAVGLFVGSRSDGASTVASASPAGPTPPATSTPAPSEEPGPSPTDGPTPTIEPTGDLGEGEHSVLAKEVVDVDGGRALVLDLGYFLMGDEANEAAAEDGLETPVPNDYYIVNDNPRLRTVPLSPGATVRYIPTSSCCDLKTWDLETWIHAVNGDVQTDMMGDMSYTWWWVTVQDGEIVAIEQQYVP